jgi:hypothetical protein
MLAMAQFDGNPDDTYFQIVVKVVFGVALLVGSPFMAYSVLRGFSNASKSNSWHETTVTIVKSEVVPESDGDGFKPSVEYTFEHEGKTYKSSRIAFRGLGGPTRGLAEGRTEKYAVGSQHKGYFDPANPDEAVLEKGTSWFHYLLLVIPLGTLGAGFFMVKENWQALVEKKGGKNRSRKSGKKRNPQKPRRPRRAEE